MAVLIGEGYRVIGPTVRDSAIVLDELDSAAQLPAGFGVETGPGYYRVVISDGEPVGLLAAWEDTGLAIVVDAIWHEPPCPGHIHRLTGSQLDGAGAAASSHGFGVPYALQLSRAMNRQPGRLVMFGIEAADTSAGSGLSTAVSAAVPMAVSAVRAELEKR